MNILDVALAGRIAASGGGGGGTDDYNDLLHLPQINGVTLSGDKTPESLGLQGELTFDTEPTEDSTNPVESGGVYSELAKKQDNLTFDGTYDASNNKAATESTVTNAINELDVSATSFDADETISSISETDGKVSVTKQDIAIASNQVVAMTGYAKPSSAPANPAIQTNDTANQAIGKLEFKADTNQTNILYAIEKVGKNLVPLKNDTLTNNGVTTSIEDSIVTVNGKSNSGLTTITLVTFALKAGTYKISGGGDSATGNDFFMRLGKAADDSYISYSSSISPVNEFTLASDTNVKLTILLNASVGQVTNVKFYPMICDKVIYDQDSTFQPYGVPNYDLTVREAEDRNALAEVVDNGAKNKLDLSKATITVGSGLTLTRDGDAYVVNGTLSEQSQIVFTNFPPVAGDNLILSGCPSNGSTAGYGIWAYNGLTRVIIDDGSDIKTPYSGEITQIKFTFAAGNYSNIRFYPMICTEADWKISQNFVPYALPNTDLTRMMTTLFPTSYTEPVVNSDISSKLSILSGGYAKAGNLVTVNLRLSVTDTISADSALFTGLPVPKTTASLSYGSAVVPVTNMCVNAQVSPNVMSIDTQGTIRLAGTSVSSDIAAGIYILSATYLSA